MNCHQLLFTNHALNQMFIRKISAEAIEALIENGQIIRSYLDDKPFPSFLILHWLGEKPLHAVVSHDNLTHICTVITAYYPDKDLWTPNFMQKIIK
jgi:Domain of unknown function (DUF4258)